MHVKSACPLTQPTSVVASLFQLGQESGASLSLHSVLLRSFCYFWRLIGGKKKIKMLFNVASLASGGTVDVFRHCGFLSWQLAALPQLSGKWWSKRRAAVPLFSNVKMTFRVCFFLTRQKQKRKLHFYSAWICTLTLWGGWNSAKAEGNMWVVDKSTEHGDLAMTANTITSIWASWWLGFNLKSCSSILTISKRQHFQSISFQILIRRSLPRNR